MKAVPKLPNAYKEIFSIDLQKDKKQAFLVNFLAIIIAVVLVIPAHFAVPIQTLFYMENGFGAYVFKFIVLMAAIVAYMVLHELIHGAAMRICGTKKVKYGFTGMYAFAGSDDFYDKRAYSFIAVAPIVLWGIVLAIMLIFVSAEWFWVLYLVQVTNLSGAAGDLYVTVKFARLSKDVLIKDHGVGMTVYAKQ